MNATCVIEFDQAEFAVVMLEAAMRADRPPGMTALDALELLEPEVRVLWLGVAAAALQYFETAVNNASPMQ